jgi:hypothetical protein
MLPRLSGIDEEGKPHPSRTVTAGPTHRAIGGYVDCRTEHRSHSAQFLNFKEHQMANHARDFQGDLAVS